MTEKLCRLTCYKSQSTKVDNESKAPHPHTISISMCCLCDSGPTASRGSWSPPTSLQLHPGLQRSIYILNIEISFSEEITLTVTRGRGFPGLRYQAGHVRSDYGTCGQMTSENSQAFLTYQKRDNCSSSGG